MQLTLVLTALLATLCSALALPQSVYPVVPVLSRVDNQEPGGAYRSAYTTGNGISSDETGYLIRSNDGLDNVLAKQGSISYTSPEGIPVYLTYVADAEGFKPQGNLIPRNA